MLRRIIGVVLVVAVLAPVVLGVVGVFVVRQIIADVEDAANQPLQRMRSDLRQAGDALSDAQQTFQRVANNIATLVQRVQQVQNSVINALTDINIPKITIPDPSISVPTITVHWSSALGITYPSSIDIGSTSISIPIPDIPAFTVPIPGLPIIRNAIRDTLGVINDLSSAVTSITGIKTLTDSIGRAAQQAQTLAERVQNVAERWRNTVILMVTLIVVGFSVAYIALMLQILAQGWAMITT